MRTDETASILASIPGGIELLNWFQGNPNFGDAEVLSLSLNRDGPSTLCVGVYKPVESSYEAVIVTITLCDMIDVELEGFSYQNVIGSLTISRATERQVHKNLLGIGLTLPDHLLVLEPCAGAFGRIYATVSKISFESSATSMRWQAELRKKN